MPRVVHFELPADDPERAINFYRTVFNWDINKWDGPEPYYLVKTGSGDGIDGAIQQRRGQTGAVNTIGVDDVDTYTAKIEANGGKIVVPKTEIPGIGFLAYAVDTEGTTFGIFQAV